VLIEFVLCIFRCTLEFESGTVLEMPIVFALVELSLVHPFEMFDILAHASFDKDHYTSGQRMVLLRRYSDVIQLLSREKCFSCHHLALSKNRLEWGALCPEFLTKYCDVKMKSSLCSKCQKNPEYVQSLKVSSTRRSDAEDSNCLTWRDIVDQRIQAKTRYFAKSKRKVPVIICDTYSNKLVPLAWASLANRISSRISYFMDAEERRLRGAPNDLLLAQMFRLLGRIILGTGSSACPHLGTISSQGRNSFSIKTILEGLFVVILLCLLGFSYSRSACASFRVP
jgi:hypothetical protein